MLLPQNIHTYNFKFYDDILWFEISFTYTFVLLLFIILSNFWKLQTFSAHYGYNNILTFIIGYTSDMLVPYELKCTFALTPLLSFLKNCAILFIYFACVNILNTYTKYSKNINSNRIEVKLPKDFTGRFILM